MTEERRCAYAFADVPSTWSATHCNAIIYADTCTDGHPQPSADLLALADEALAGIARAEDVPVEEWAARLAQDVEHAND